MMEPISKQYVSCFLAKRGYGSKPWHFQMTSQNHLPVSIGEIHIFGMTRPIISHGPYSYVYIIIMNNI